MFQELLIQTVSAEIEALKADPNAPARLEEAMEECSRLKYRSNIVSRVSDDPPPPKNLFPSCLTGFASSGAAEGAGTLCSLAAPESWERWEF